VRGRSCTVLPPDTTPTLVSGSDPAPTASRLISENQMPRAARSRRLTVSHHFHNAPEDHKDIGLADFLNGPPVRTGGTGVPLFPNTAPTACR
jgi:hypothetical protein